MTPAGAVVALEEVQIPELLLQFLSQLDFRFVEQHLQMLVLGLQFRIPFSQLGVGSAQQPRLVQGVHWRVGPVFVGIHVHQRRPVLLLRYELVRMQR